MRRDTLWRNARLATLAGDALGLGRVVDGGVPTVAGNGIGTVEASNICDLVIWDNEQPAALVCRMGFNPLHARVRSDL